MSLEQKIEALTAAVEKLTAKLEGGSKTPLFDKVTGAAPNAAKETATKPAAEKPVKEAKPAKEEKPKAEAKAVSYDDVRDTIVAAVEKLGKPAVREALKENFGTENAKEITDEKKWPQVISVIKALVAESETPEADEDDVA